MTKTIFDFTDDEALLMKFMLISYRVRDCKDIHELRQYFVKMLELIDEVIARDNKDKGLQ